MSPSVSSYSPPTDAGRDGRTIVFFHPDLGIGGAERLVVDAAVGLQARGWRVVIFTNHCDPGHCFDECRDGTLDVRVRGHWLVPMSIASRLTILCAILRHMHLLLQIYLSRELASLAPTALVVDQLSAGLPLLRTLVSPSAPILFYCHFPDLLLAQGRTSSALKRLYRLPFDAIEEWSMAFAQAVAVNSNFTKRTVERTWPRLASHTSLNVVYPCVDTRPKGHGLSSEGEKVFPGQRLLLSINRFERKKDIALAIKAFAAIPEDERNGVRLVLAGGYDSRVSENVQYHSELQYLATSLQLTHHTFTNPSSLGPSSSSASVLFLLSIPNELKASLLRSAHLLLYTPSNEHFGIVPLEAMLARLPVLAANTGGPVETVRDGETGWLRSPDDVQAWTDVARRALRMSDQQIRQMGDNGAGHVRREFSRDSMAERLDCLLRGIVTTNTAAAANKGALSSQAGAGPGAALGVILVITAVAGAIWAFTWSAQRLGDGASRAMARPQ